MRFDDMVQAAEMLSKSTIVPMNYRHVNKKGEPNPSAAANILAVMFAGQDYGWNPMTAMRLMNVIEGNAALKPEAVLGLARKAGHHVSFEFAPDEVVVHGKRADTGDEASASFSMRDAARAGLSHKDVWKKYPEDMMMWRAVAKLGRRLFPDLMLGASYTSEELGGAMPEAELTARPRPTEIEPVADVIELENPATGEPEVVEVPEEESPPLVGGSIDPATGTVTPPSGWSNHPPGYEHLDDTPPGNLAPSLTLVKERAEEAAEDVDVGAVIASGDAKAQLLARVAAQLGKEEDSTEAIDAARDIWQEEVGIGAKHIDMGEMSAMLARVDAIGSEAF